MSGAKSISRWGILKKVDRSSRSATRMFSLDKGRRSNSAKETNSTKSCNCLVKPDSWKGSKSVQNSKLAIKKANMKCAVRDAKKRSTSTNHHQKVVIVSKRSSSVSVVKSCKLRKSVSVKKVSYSTSVVLSSDEEDSDSEEESEEEDKNECSTKKKTTLKHTTSKVKSSVQVGKKTKNKSMNKDKAIKLLCEKLSSGGKHKGSPPRELRPRFPYNSLQEWPTARTHRMASLNALAKVHVLYENEGRVVGENMQEVDETTLIDFLNENSDEDIEIKKELKPIISLNQKKNEKAKILEEKPKFMKKDNSKKDINPRKDIFPAKTKIRKRGKKRKLPEVEIIDTKVCKRMASLNAQAILAASYQFEPKPKRNYKKSDKSYNSSDTETEIDVSNIKKEKEDSEYEVIVTPKSTFKKNDQGQQEDVKNLLKSASSKNAELSISKKVTKGNVASKKNIAAESEVAIVESSTSAATVTNRSCTVASTAGTTKVGMTKYTEVTKVQINTHKDSEVKEESKSERKIEHIVSNEDVAITQLYHYQSKTANESYCLQMQTTYKPSSKAVPLATNLPSTSEVRPFTSETSLSNSPSYYGQSSMLPSQVYPNIGPVPPAGMDRRLPHHCGASAFSVPRFKHSQHMQFPSNEYGYYQPAGPLIQPIQDQVIHKPVPYHPQPNRHQAPQRPQPSHEGFQTFESRQPQQDKLTMPFPSLPQQKSLVSPSSESQSQSQTPPQTSRPREDARNRNLSKNPSPSFQQPSKHVRSPVMPTLYSSQRNFRSYHTQKREPNALGNYGQPYEQKDQCSKLVGYDSRKETGRKLVGYGPTIHTSSAGKSASREASRSSFQSSKDIQTSNSHPGDLFKNMSDTRSQKLKMWDYKMTHGPTPTYNPSLSSSLCNDGTTSNMNNPGTSLSNSGTSSNFLPYHNTFRKDTLQTNLNEGEYPRRPPSVITIDEDSPRDTKTYIQLEVPKNSHREKIVVVDVEDDEIEEEHINPNTSNVLSTNFNRNLDKPEKKNVLSGHVSVPNSVFDRPQNKCTHNKVSETSKTVYSDPSNLIEKNARSCDISKPSFEKSQEKLEKKQMLSISDMPKTIDRPQDTVEKKQVHSRNSDVPKTSSDRPQDMLENTHIHLRNSDVPETTFNRTQDNIEKKHIHSKSTCLNKNICDTPQDEIERKQIHMKNSDMTKTTFDKLQDKIVKQIHSRSSSTSNLSVDTSQDEIEKTHSHLRYSNSSKKTFEQSQDKIENKYNPSRIGDMRKASFEKPQDKIEKKHSRDREKLKETLQKPPEEIENKHKYLRISETPNKTFDEPQDQMEKKHDHSKNNDKVNSDKQLEKKNLHPNSFDDTESNFDINQSHLFFDLSIVKKEDEDETDTNEVQEKGIPLESKKFDEVNNDSLDVMFLEVKKKKESAVVRRAKMHGKQRTFRDCYNRPLAQKKKDDNLTLSEQHLSKDFQPSVCIPRVILPKLEKPPTHGWSWEGTPQDKLVYISNEEPPVLRRCFPSIKHVEGDIISVRDCVLLKSGSRKTDVPYIAKVTALWERPTNGEMTMSLFWYYRPEHTEAFTRIKMAEDEILASNHRDVNSVACIEDKCFVLTYSEYCRYRKGLRVYEDSSASLATPVPELEDYERRKLLPPFNVSPDLVLFCRRVYDHQLKKLLPNPM